MKGTARGGECRLSDEGIKYISRRVEFEFKQLIQLVLGE
jgi:hypothetical protein